MILINKEDVEEMLKTTDELPAYAFKILDEKLQKIKPQAVIRDCKGSFGASFGDCEDCKELRRYIE